MEPFLSTNISRLANSQKGMITLNVLHSKQTVMKALLIFVIFILAASTLPVFAQHPGSKLYWVIETNIVKRDISYLKFYDERDQMVHEIKIENRIDITRRRDKRMLVNLLKRYSNSITSTGKKSKIKNKF